MRLAYLILAAAFVASFAGSLHPAFDALATFRVPLSAVMIIAWVCNRRALATLPMAIIAMMGLAWNHALWQAGVDRESNVTLFQHNVRATNTALEELTAAIKTTDPDIITLQEISLVNVGLLTRLQGDYPHQHVCSFGQLYSMAVLSRLPQTESLPICSAKRGLAAMEVMGPDGPGWVASVHLVWPWPYPQRPQSDGIARQIAALEGPVIVAGDFNQLPWSHAVRSITEAAGAQYLGPRRRTFQLLGLPLPLDHVLAASGEVTRLGRIGSDHRALVAQVSFK
ncbi:MAG: endonuclease/exonuclease/phosphatase family protein [Pseudomonadota bacterium]